MQHVIIGTAGHVDHGKTTLIRALTGIETDRLREEQERGMSIKLGFAYFDLPDGSRAGIVDVPGHERFIKQMLIGAYGLDVVLLLIDATEGVKPQTEEHLDILDLLGVRTGIVVITKIDLASEEEREFCAEEAAEVLRGTSLEGSPVVFVSSVTGEGLEELRAQIVAQVAQARQHPRPPGIARLYVDRVFPVTGFGTVVTGTLLGGSLRREERVNLLPSHQTARIRGIQNHGRDVDEAFSGQRVALNLSGLGAADLERGEAVCSAEVRRVTDRVDTVLRLRASNPDFFTHWTRVRFYVGTHEVFGRAVILGADEVLPGDECYVQFRLESPILAFRTDRFIIRDFSAQRTLGGGQILDPFPPRHKRLSEATQTRLGQWREADDATALRLLVDHSSTLAVPEDLTLYYLPRPAEIREAILHQAERSGLLRRWRMGDEAWLVSVAQVQQVEREIQAKLAAFHEAEPLAPGENANRLRRELSRPVDEASFDRLIEQMSAAGQVVKEGNFLRLAAHRIEFSGREGDIREAIESLYRRTGFNAPSREEVKQQLSAHPPAAVDKVFQALLRLGVLVDLGEGVVLHQETVQQGIEAVTNFIREKGPLTVADFRNLMDTSRKYAVPFLEYCDRQQITRREGDYRRLRNG